MNEPNKLRAARTAAGWSQPRLIAALRASAPRFRMVLPADASLKTNIKRWESGRVSPGPEYQRLFQFVYAMTADQLGFPAPQHLDVTPAPLAGDALDYYRRLLDDHVRADNLSGSAYILDIVRHQVGILSKAARDARGAQRIPVLRMATRYYEFYGWLLQDTGQVRDATRATDRARDFAFELNDGSLSAYLMMRRSNIATDSGDPALAAGLADGALTVYAPLLTPKGRAVLLRQKANAHAGLGDAAGCSSAIAEAFDVAQSNDQPDDLAGYCTPAYVAMEAGTCWLELGNATKALEAFSRSDSEWNPALRRDHGLSLARLATANAGVGDTDECCRTAQQAITIARITGSARTLGQLRRLRAELAPRARDAHVAEVRQAIADLPAIA